MIWYCLKSDNKNMRQVIMELPSVEPVESKFAILGLAAKYENLLSQKWCAGYFRTDADLGPFLLVRADNYVELLRDCPLRLCLSFHYEPSGGLFGIFLEADSSMIKSVSPTGLPTFECVYGLDGDDVVSRIKDALKNDTIHLCFAGAADGWTHEIIDDSGGSQKMTSPHCKFDKIFSVPEKCSQVLTSQFEQLLTHHSALSNNVRDYKTSMQQLNNTLPVSENPLLGDSYKCEPEEMAFSSDRDELYKDARAIVVQSQQGSISLLQRRLKIEFSRAARLIDQMEEEGVVGQAIYGKPREVLMSLQELNNLQ